MFIALALFLILADQLTKYYIQYKLTSSLPIIKGFLYFTYVQNKGASFGIMQGKQIILIIITVITFISIAYYLIKNSSNISKLSKAAFAFIIAGASGNLIDRLRFGYVIDFIQFKLFSFPIFNLSDILIVTGCLIIALQILRNKI